MQRMLRGSIFGAGSRRAPGDDGLDGGARRPSRIAERAVAGGEVGDCSWDELCAGDRPDGARRGGERGRISVYAQGGDYHKTVKKALKALARFIVERVPSELKVFVDTAPVMEKPLAAAAGIGWQGKHTNLVSPRAWQLAVPRRDPHGAGAGAGCAGHRGCIAEAARAASRRARRRQGRSHRIDARKCISYLTIEHDGPIPVEFREAMGNRIYGCDDCLAVCPWNRFAESAAANRAFLPRAELAAPKLADLLSSTMPRSARCSPDRRSSGSGAIG